MKEKYVIYLRTVRTEYTSHTAMMLNAITDDKIYFTDVHHTYFYDSENKPIKCGVWYFDSVEEAQSVGEKYIIPFYDIIDYSVCKVRITMNDRNEECFCVNDLNGSEDYHKIYKEVEEVYNDEIAHDARYYKLVNNKKTIIR